MRQGVEGREGAWLLLTPLQPAVQRELLRCGQLCGKLSGWRRLCPRSTAAQLPRQKHYHQRGREQPPQQPLWRMLEAYRALPALS